MPRESIVFFTDRDLGTRFPEILSNAGLNVRRHRFIGKEGWVAVSHDTRIRYKPNELAAVIRHRARLLVVIGKAPFPELARHFVATAPRIVDFLSKHSAPWIAKVYRASATELAENPAAPGNVSLWYPQRS